MGRLAPWLIVLAACHSNSTLDITGDQKFDRIELFFVTQDPPVTDVDTVMHTPRTSPAIEVPIADGPSTRWLRAFHDNNTDIWTGDPTTAIRLGLPGGLGVGSYVGVVATQHTADGKDNPVAFGELTGYTDGDGITYPVQLSPITATVPSTGTVPAALTGVHWLVECNGIATSSCAYTLHLDPPVMISGTSAEQYLVHARIRGVMEPNVPPSGVLVTAPFTMLAGTAGPANAFELAVGSTKYLLNAAAHDTGAMVQPWDYTVTFPVAGGDVIMFELENGRNAVETNNFDSARVPFQIPGVTTNPDPFDGQFARLDVLDVTRVADAALTSWPEGLEVWTAHGADQACLRATIKGTTNFVVTEGDVDCDSFVDADDCDPLRYCDPTSQHPGCAVTCDTQVHGECMIGTCVNDYTSSTGKNCAIGTEKPSVCFACDSNCMGDDADRATTLACVTADNIDGTCPYYYSSGPILCTTAITLAFAENCADAAIVSADPGFPLSVFVDSTMPCMLTLAPEQTVDFVPATYEVMIGLETATGATDTYVVQLTPSSTGGCTTLPTPCQLPPAAHDCAP